MRWTCLLALLVAVCAATAEPPLVTLAVPFETGPDATDSRGAGTAVARHDATGRGSWTVRTVEDGLGWAGSGNLDKARGSLGFHLKAGWPAGEQTTWRLLVADDAGFNDKGQNAFRLWKYESSIRFDLRSPGDKYPTFPIANLKPDTWHHLAVTWDATIGTRLYLDGRRMAGADYTFTPRPARWLFLGASGETGDRMTAGLGDYRDLVVWDRLLTDDEVASWARGELARTAAPKLTVTTSMVPAPPTGPAQVVFRASFENTLTADVAAAGREPRRSAKVEFVDSPRGRAAHFADGAVLEYPGGANLPHDRGAVGFWVRPDWAADRAVGDRIFLYEAPPDQPGDDQRRVWFWGDANSLRFDLRDPADSYVRASMAAWAPGTWHHLVLGWDAARGQRTVHVDGRRTSGLSDSGKSFVPLQPWPPKPKTHFWVGSRDGQAAARAAIDELTIWDRPPSDAEVTREYARVAPVSAQVTTPYLPVGAPRLRLALTNRDDRPVTALQASLTGVATRTIALPGDLAAGATRDVDLPLGDLPAGDYRVAVAPPGGVAGPGGVFRLDPPAPPPVRQAPTEKLVVDLDLTAELGADGYTDTGDCQVVDSPLGRYREASTARGSRFAVRLRPLAVGRWHRLEWTWPDDQPRTVDVVLNRSRYDVATGTLAGDEYPGTGRLRTQWCWFWPRVADDSAVFMTAETGRPAAVARVRVYELSGPPAAAPAPPAATATRRVGLYYEDPVLSMNFGGEPSFPSFGEVADRLVAYLEANGYNTLYYPAVWYHGPLYPSASQGDGQRNSRPHPDDFLAYLLRRFEGRGLQLQMTLNVHDLPSLAGVEADEERVRAGASTPITVTWNGGLKLSGWHGTPGDLNPLAPEVQQPVRELFREMIGRYAGSPAFGGVCLHLPIHSLLWFGSLETGYNDELLTAFQRDTGIQLGLDPRDPFRANRAYRQLMGPHRERWTAWRAAQITAYWGDLAAMLRAARGDLTLTVNPYSSIDNTGFVPDQPPEEYDYLAESLSNGADLPALAKIPNVQLMHTLAPGLYRWQRAHGRQAPETRIYRVFNCSPAAYEPFAKLGAPFGINLHDKYWENDIGARQPLTGVRAWGQSELGWRVSTPVPPAPYGLENYAWALGEADVMTLTKGGFVVGTVGLEDQLKPWVAAFSRLPAAPFRDLAALVDPVRVRTLSRADGEWAYAQNRLPEPLTVELAVAGAGALTDLVTGQPVPLTAGRARLTLPPYGLVALRAPAGGARVTGGQVTGTQAIAARLRERLAALRTKLAAAAPAARDIAAPRLALAERLLAEGHLARASLVLEEPWEGRL